MPIHYIEDPDLEGPNPFIRDPYVEEMSWKERKEEFVSGLKGTTLFEIVVISAHFPAFLMLRAILMRWIPLSFRTMSFFRFVFDFAMIILPIILAVTVLSDVSTYVLLAVMIFNFTALLFLRPKSTSNKKESNTSYVQQQISNARLRKISKKTCDLNDNIEYERLKDLNAKANVVSSKLPFVTCYRAFVSIATCVCILAVDFHVFPRRLAKTEEFGSGLMDVGVGMYILSNAIVSREARTAHRPTRTRLSFRALVFQIISSWPVVVLGTIRLVSVKLLGYNEHIAEYGMHWNFFLSLACVKNLAAIVAFLTEARFSLFAFAFIAFSYQLILVYPFLDATTILLNDDREGLLMQNKEGLASCIGLLALYFAGVSLGSYLFKPRNNMKDWKKTAGRLFIVSATLWFVLYKCETEVQPISRRLGNLAYLLWMLALSMLIIAAILCVHIISSSYITNNLLPDCSMPDRWHLNPPEKTAEKIVYSPPNAPYCLISALARNQLFYFLVSNLATGIINGVIDTLTIDHYYAVIIICAYQFLITWCFWYLHVNNITLKVW